MKKDKVILVDCDGVLLDWMYAFDQWMTRHGFTQHKPEVYDVAEQYGLEKPFAKMLVRMFNESANIRKLPPLRDAVKYIKKFPNVTVNIRITRITLLPQFLFS